MIVWGTYVRKKVVGTGQFFCPGCRQQRDYRLRRPKKWGHLYWIPLIPMGEFGQYVECASCGKAWDEAVLSHDPIKEQRERAEGLSTAIAQIMILASGEHDGPSPGLVKAIRATVQGLVGVDMTPDSISKVAGEVTDHDRVLGAAAAQAAYLTERGKDLVLRAAISAVAAQPLDGSRRATIAEIGQRLGMMPAHVNGVLAETGLPAAPLRPA